MQSCIHWNMSGEPFASPNKIVAAARKDAGYDYTTANAAIVDAEDSDTVRVFLYLNKWAMSADLGADVRTGALANRYVHDDATVTAVP